MTIADHVLNPGTLANRVDPNQMRQNAESDQGLHCVLTVQEFKG